MGAKDTLTRILDAVEARRARLDVYTKAWAGESPAAFLSKKSSDALDGRLRRLSVGWPRLIIHSRVDRLRVNGFRRAGEQSADAGLWELYRRAGLIGTSELVHTDRDLYGSAFVTVWGHATRPRTPVVTASSPLTTGVETDPATGEVIRAARRWSTGEHAHAVLFEPDVIRTFRANTPDMPAAGQWTVVDSIDNPFSVVPLVPFIRRASIDDHEGTSAVADVLDLTDAAAKTLQDALVTSEFYARPRRWATGLELVYGEDGRPVDPFGDGRFLQAEDPAAKFGQLDPPRLDGYADLMATITQQIGALTGLPPHYLGLHGDQPANADSIRAAETQLTSAAYSEQRALDPSWSLVASLLHAVAHAVDVDAIDPVPLWASPEVRTHAQGADAAVKLHSIGVPLAALLEEPLGVDPQRARSIVETQRADLINRAGLDLSKLLPARRPE